MFAIWLTGRPASGKTTAAELLLRALRSRGLDPQLLNGAAFAKTTALDGVKTEKGKVALYRAMAHAAELLVRHGVPVIIDATANRRAYRDWLRNRVPVFVETYLECPAEVCLGRNSRARPTVYEPPLRPEVRTRTDIESPKTVASNVMEWLAEKGCLPKVHRHG